MLKIATAQYSMNKHSSLNAFKSNAEDWVKEAATHGARLVIFPEYGSIELVSLMAPEIQKNLAQQLKEIQKYKDDFLNCYLDLAKKYKVYIIAPSFPLELEGKYINRAFFINPEGLYGYQDKQVMTRFEDEEWKVSSPDQRKLNVFDVDGVKVGISICFDVEFPDFSRELALSGITLLIAPSCTETPAGMNRVHVGARARALENQIYVAVSQTVGDVDYSEAIDRNTGMAAVYSTCDKGFPDDGIIVQGEVNYPKWVYADINPDLITNVRTNGSVLNFKKITILVK
ncbi:hypothetical protein DOM21_15420 [Bacteriovorax stolpii]|uniref:Uncharacterized protein n=1 Tax=Bacteriovorax stolpii TaxID=960 RepID=A0A2K9NP26_BACTC|nr:carbon-nitrogen hydrolase family protein [Bacteriovorax stolpii]AUN97247.1 hypothetical protein C0V70_03805 [Bacteriovorax stolpii]QDK42814.1 hypothetical protein DOM21_15420 [Bacteriovorax stolpii]TDP53535.1 putative amidohydrolase [Bacteriovorax stolpii]